MHAGSILLLWVLAVLLVQMVEGIPLALAVSASLALALVFARAHCLRLVKRVRILLLAILVLFAWSTPGEAIFIDWPRLSPSREGVLYALVHGGRLLAVVCWVAILLARMSADRLVGGLYALARPLAVVGVSAERVALRLLLVLRYVDEARASGRDWRCWLTDDEDGEGDAVCLRRERPGWWDVLALAAGIAVFVVVWRAR
ncbi:MAG: energy-coupling factor transporter transmembrane protein EcfT [Azoarcus sp.]|jgi:energy-coupling factor transporter transmembrane protein EcfT|nr:energy-coupling factor transporter transmembrane protein EcfT [Azoarcus sp.]